MVRKSESVVCVHYVDRFIVPDSIIVAGSMIVGSQLLILTEPGLNGEVDMFHMVIIINDSQLSQTTIYRYDNSFRSRTTELQRMRKLDPDNDEEPAPYSSKATVID